jgi:hypothetical protein
MLNKLANVLAIMLFHPIDNTKKEPKESIESKLPVPDFDTVKSDTHNSFDCKQ